MHCEGRSVTGIAAASRSGHVFPPFFNFAFGPLWRVSTDSVARRFFLSFSLCPPLSFLSDDFLGSVWRTSAPRFGFRCKIDWILSTIEYADSLGEKPRIFGKLYIYIYIGGFVYADVKLCSEWTRSIARGVSLSGRFSSLGR